MYKLLVAIVAVGAAIGWLMPAGRSTEPGPDAPAAAPAAAETAASQAHQASWSDETRVPRGENGHFFVDASVNGQAVHFLVDTGASGVALTVEDAERVGITVSPASFEIVGSGASGPVRGQPIRLESVELDGKHAADIDGIVAEGLEISLLGQSYLSRLASVEMRGNEMILR